MKTKTNRLCLLGLLILVLTSAQLAAQEPERVWFGLGGSSAGLLLPELGLVNAFLLDLGFAALPDMVWSAGGRGRGGLLHGLSIGGIGWAAGTSSQLEDRIAEFGVGFGGIELGYVVGGDQRSLLTVGLVLGGGGSSLTLREQVDGGGGCWPFSPCGIVVGPVTVTAASAFVAIEPFISFQVQPIPFVGFEVHLGYLLPIAGVEWGDLGVDGPALRPEGPVIGFSLTWGAIGRLRTADLVGEETVTETAELIGPCVTVEGAMGEIVIEAGMGSESKVEVTATKHTLWKSDLDDVLVQLEPTRCGLRVFAEGPTMRPWSVDYRIRVPEGIELDVRQGIGEVRLVGVSGSASVELGIGQVTVSGFEGTTMTIGGGVGQIVVTDASAERIDISLGTGDIDILLLPEASYELLAGVGIGGIEIESFPGTNKAELIGPGGRIETILGEGEHEFVIDLGIGEISVSPLL
ncbi:MAG: hypothetical protein MUP13_12775 [Thermoanaerobaculales bacterium]|nr:hypothetical protein [Thermoanaerobaculales bacterium]